MINNILPGSECSIIIFWLAGEIPFNVHLTRNVMLNDLV